MQLSHAHPDQHYAACLFRDPRNCHSSLRFHHLSFPRWQTPHQGCGYPVERVRSVIVGQDVTFCVGDRDFTKFKAIPSLSLVCDVPSSIEESFCCGQIMVSVKDATFQPSSPLSHAAELKADLHHHFIHTIRRPVLFLYTDGGLDHNVTFGSVKVSLIGSVKVSLIALFRFWKLNYLLALSYLPWS